MTRIANIVGEAYSARRAPSTVTPLTSYSAPVAIIMLPVGVDGLHRRDVEPIPMACMTMKAIKTPMGSMMMATKALRTWSRNTMQTRAMMRLSSASVCLSVSMAR